MKYGALIIENRFDVKETINRHAKFLPQGWEIVHYCGSEIKTANDYNKLLTSIEFWKAVPFDKVLIFQHDSGLLRRGIQEFLGYDFIGAPLYHIDFPCMNGGLSLRSKEAMIECVTQLPWNPSLGNEDIYFCNLLKRMPNMNLPTKEVAQKFSVETIYSEGSLGYHAIDKYLTEEQCNTILNQYKI